MTTRLAGTIALVAATTLLGGCATGADGTAAGTTPTTTTPTTPTTTVTVTATSSIPAPTLSRPGKPNPTFSTPPPAKDPAVIPDDPKAYGQAFVTAWVDRDRARAQRLGTATAVEAAFDSAPRAAPAFRSCEGAAGSSYCIWQGDEYTMTVRILNEKSSLRQEHAVTEVTFTH
jgi:hypothetical protein